MKMHLISIIAIFFLLSGCGGKKDVPESSSPGSSSSASSSSGGNHSSQSCNESTPQNWPCSWQGSDGSYGGCHVGSGCGSFFPISSSSSSSSGGSLSSSTSSSSSSASSSSGGNSYANCNTSTPENWPCSWQGSDGSYGGCSVGTGCGWYSPGGSSSSSSSGGPITPPPPPECEDGFVSAEIWKKAYPLAYSEVLGVISSTDGDFENTATITDAVTFNEDPRYVFSGMRSGQLINNDFVTFFRRYHKDNLIHDGNLWLYSTSNKTEQFVIELSEPASVCGEDRPDNIIMQKSVEVPSHEWTHIAFDVGPNVWAIDLILSVRRPAEGNVTTEFYIDDLVFSGTTP